MKKIQNVRGTRDLLEEEFSLYQEIINNFREISSKFGFKEIETPILESSEVFRKSLGLTSDIIKKETYTFNDRSNNQITLRPEGTASIVRCFINSKLNQMLPQKLTYVGPMFRYDRPQQGRLRQFHQLGAEIIGVGDISADLELIQMSIEFLEKVNLKRNDFDIQVNTLGDLESRKKYSAKLKYFFQDYKKDLTQESLDRLERNPLRILDTKNQTELKIIEKAPKLSQVLNDESLEIFGEFKNGCKKLGINITINEKLVRGLDYYNHICFEFVSKKLGSQNSILAGGRYDGLIRNLGGPHYSGCGFAAGIERIILALLFLKRKPTEKLKEKIFTVISLGKKNDIEVMKIARKFRKDLKKTVIDIICKSNLSQGLKYANEKKATHAIIIGDDELSKKIVNLKDLNKKVQKEISISNLSKELSKI